MMSTVIGHVERTEPVAHEKLEAAADPLEQERRQYEEEDATDASWYMGKAKDEFKRRKEVKSINDEDEDPIQVSPSSALISHPCSLFVVVGKRTTACRTGTRK